MVLVGHQITHRFGRNILFRDLSLRVEGGTSLSVTGPNGSGKSTLLLILAGLLTPRRGEIRLEDGATSISDDEMPFHCGMVAPYLHVYEGLTARENLAFVARARSLPDATQAIEDSLEVCELNDRDNELVATFSSGMKQRVKLAVAALIQPAVLILDEPSTNLDEQGKALVRRLQKSQLEKGRLLLVATNDEAEAAQCNQRLVVTDFR